MCNRIFLLSFLGADNSEVSGISRASKKSGQYDQLTVPRTLLTEQITLGEYVYIYRAVVLNLLMVRDRRMSVLPGTTNCLGVVSEFFGYLII